MWMSSLWQDKVGQVHAISKKVVTKFCGHAKLVCHSLSSIHPLEGAAFGKGFVAKLCTARRTAEQLATPTIIYANYRGRQLDYSKLSTTLPGFCSNQQEKRGLPSSFNV